MIELKEFDKLVESLGCKIDHGYTSVAYSNYTHRQIAYYDWDGHARLFKIDRYFSMSAGISFYTLESLKNALLDELCNRKMIMIKLKKESIDRDFI